MFEDLKGRTASSFGGRPNKRSIAWAIAQGLHTGRRQPCNHLSETSALGRGSQGDLIFIAAGESRKG